MTELNLSFFRCNKRDINSIYIPLNGNYEILVFAFQFSKVLGQAILCALHGFCNMLKMMPKTKCFPFKSQTRY